MIDWDALMPSSPHLGSARYAFAAEEIRGLAQRHGGHTITRIITWLMQDDNRHHPSAILHAIEAVTGEDIARRLYQYGEEADDAFRGIAIKDLRYAVLSDDVAADASVEISPGQPVLLAHASDLLIQFLYEVLEQPADVLDHPVYMQIEVTDGVTRIGYAELVLNEKQRASASTRLALQDTMMTGEEKSYNIIFMINGNVLLDNPIILT